MMKRLLLLIVLLIGVSTLRAETVEQKIDSTQLAYYRWCNAHITDPLALAKADTLFQLADKDGNRRMQSVALCLKMDHYSQTRNLDSLKITFAETRDFTYRYKQFTHLFIAWGRLALFYARQQKYTLAQYELQQMMELARREDYKEGIATSYKLMAQIYHTQQLYEAALNTYLTDIKYVEDNHIDYPQIYYLYTQAGVIQSHLDRVEESDALFKKAMELVQLPEQRNVIEFEQMSNLIKLRKIGEARKLFDRLSPHLADRISAQRVAAREVQLLHYEHRYKEAIDLISQRIKIEEEQIAKNGGSVSYNYFSQYRNRAQIYQAIGNYQQAYEDLLQSISIQDEYKSQQNAIQLEETATLLDVDRLKIEKAAAQEQTQLEKARRTRLTIITLAIILVLAAVFIVVLMQLNHRLRIATRAAEQSNRMKSIFIRDVTHEINTPLNAIVGFSELAATTTADDPERDSFIDLVKTNSGYLQKIVDDMLYISDLESETKYEPRPTEINACCTECISATVLPQDATETIAFQPARTTLTTTLPNQLLSKALREMLLNAVKFSGAKGIVLAYTISDDQKWLTISVSDHGPGIPAEKAELIFERFEKVDTFTQGMGLGLSLCRLIASTLGGEIQLDSNYTQGAKFDLRIPLTIQ